MTHKHWWLIPLILAVAIVLVSCGGGPAPKVLPTPITTTSPGGRGSSSSRAVTASGEIVPAQKASLSFAIAGRVQKIDVALGDKVKAGDVLIALDTSQIEAEVAQAEAGLKVAQAQLAQIKAGARPAEIAAAEQAIKEAEAAAWGAATRLAQTKKGATQADIAAAEAAVAQAAVERKVAQDSYDLASKCYNFKWPDGTKDSICPSLGTVEEQTRAMLHSAEQSYQAAGARLDQLSHGATPEQIDTARAEVAAASARKAVVQAQLDLLKEGSTREQFAVAQASEAQAQAALDLVRVMLHEATLRAPFDGVVAAVDVNPGETVSPGQAVLVLGYQSQLRAETTDLSERDVWRISVGDQAAVYVEALRTEIKGRIVRIAPRSSKAGGDVVYTVVAELDEQPAGLRWGMSVKVEIATE